MSKKRLPDLPEIPTKRYFRIHEASELCGVRDYVLRFWEKEFPQLRPKKRGSHRAYVKKDLLIVRRIRELTYGEGYKIPAAREILSRELEAIRRGEQLPREELTSKPNEFQPSETPPTPTLDIDELDSIISDLEKLSEFLHN